MCCAVTSTCNLYPVRRITRIYNNKYQSHRVLAKLSRYSFNTCMSQQDEEILDSERLQAIEKLCNSIHTSISLLFSSFALLDKRSLRLRSQTMSTSPVPSKNSRLFSSAKKIITINILRLHSIFNQLQNCSSFKNYKIIQLMTETHIYFFF